MRLVKETEFLADSFFNGTVVECFRPCDVMERHTTCDEHDYFIVALASRVYSVHNVAEVADVLRVVFTGFDSLEEMERRRYDCDCVKPLRVFFTVGKEGLVHFPVIGNDRVVRKRFRVHVSVADERNHNARLQPFGLYAREVSATRRNRDNIGGTHSVFQLIRYGNFDAELFAFFFSPLFPLIHVDVIEDSSLNRRDCVLIESSAALLITPPPITPTTSEPFLAK